ncbi:MAG: entericidin A/B family lipoprotein [Comamonadaceae bacterium]|nr:MAG: entericidin A/B family lipoprotein [Comamonadaceae bacterium]
MKKLSTLMAIVFTASIALTGCNTMKGAGQDVQKAGEKVEDAAKKRQ